MKCESCGCELLDVYEVYEHICISNVDRDWELIYGCQHYYSERLKENEKELK